MNVQKANLLNAVTLFSISLWAYFSSMNPSITSLIPLLFGVMLLSLNNGVLHGLKGQTRAAFVLTLIVAIALIKPLLAAVDADKSIAIFRTSLMMFTSIVAIFFFINIIKK